MKKSFLLTLVVICLFYSASPASDWMYYVNYLFLFISGTFSRMILTPIVDATNDIASITQTIVQGRLVILSKEKAFFVGPVGFLGLAGLLLNLMKYGFFYLLDKKLSALYITHVHTVWERRKLTSQALVSSASILLGLIVFLIPYCLFLHAVFGCVFWITSENSNTEFQYYYYAYTLIAVFLIGVPKVFLFQVAKIVFGENVVPISKIK